MASEPDPHLQEPGPPHDASGSKIPLAGCLYGGAILALGIFVGIQTALMRIAPAQSAAGPRLFPFLVAAGLGIVGLMLLYESAGRRKRPSLVAFDWQPVVLIAAALMIHLMLLEFLGWIIASALLFMCVAHVFERGRFVLNGLLGLLLATIIYFFFTHALTLRLPKGVLATLIGGGV